ncbi:MAG: ribbon-helix-helix domain-containing protein [Mycobacterium sp.]
MSDPGFVGFRAAPALCRRLDELAEARGLNRSSAMRAAILEATVPEHATWHRR